MEQAHFFHTAKWVGAAQRTAGTFSVLRGHFPADKPRKATLRVLGLGFFKCYINGQCINPDTFLPLSSEYEPGSDPKDEVMSGHRIYVPEFDILPFLRPGDNVIAIHYGGGWYTFPGRVFGLPKAIYCVCLDTDAGTQHHVSDETCRVGGSYITEYLLTEGETQNHTRQGDLFSPDTDDSNWPFAVLTEEPNTRYCTTDCPVDTLIRELPVRKVKEDGAETVYDCGQNTVGYPVFALRARAGETVKVTFSEDILPDGSMDSSHCHNQAFTVISDGENRLIQPEFTWYGFRCFAVSGDAEPQCVKVVHADVPVTSAFSCDNATLNWIYDTFVHTMGCNLHTGHPTDCPHIERRGYTGDGQLTCHAALSSMDAGKLYEKWLQDIADGQDMLSGNVQNTAPYLRSGGGPGGWGCAIIEVAYQLYLHSGDIGILSRHYGAMVRYLDFLQAHTEFGLITYDGNGKWCLGDWCAPVILYPEKDITCQHQQFLIPAPMVNTYYAVRALERMCQIAKVLGKDADIPAYRDRAQQHKKAIQTAYYNPIDGNFVMNAQGANAFALDLGLGGKRTYPNLVSYYQKLGCYDTGIFATDVLTRLLFERGEGELAVDLLTQDGSQGFENWRRNGATTFHEFWNSGRSRSHNHPMFGAVVACFFDFLLGIRQKEGTAGYCDVIIAPQAVSKFANMSGSLQTPNGTIVVSYEKDSQQIRFAICIPPRTEALLQYAGKEYALTQGENVLVLPQ